MLKNDKERKICEKYSARDSEGFVHCFECPLKTDRTRPMCKAVAHYDRHRKKWVLDKELEV